MNFSSTGFLTAIRANSHRVGSVQAIIHNKDGSKPRAATMRCVFHESKLTSAAAGIKIAHVSGTLPYMFGLNLENNMLKYSAGTRINKVILRAFRENTISIPGFAAQLDRCLTWRYLILVILSLYFRLSSMSTRRLSPLLAVEAEFFRFHC